MKNETKDTSKEKKTFLPKSYQTGLTKEVKLLGIVMFCLMGLGLAAFIGLSLAIQEYNPQSTPEELSGFHLSPLPSKAWK